MHILTHSITLPADYQVQDWLNFHQRDSEPIAERVTAHSLEKGFIWDNTPAHLIVHFNDGCAHAQLHLDRHSNSTVVVDAHWPKWLEYFLGVHQPITEFQQQHQQHPELGRIVCKQSGLRIAQTSTPFEALSWAIIGQQISVAAALNIRRRFIELADIPHSSGLYCYPDPARVAALELEQLRSVGLSLNKARAIAHVSLAMQQRSLHFPQQLDAHSVEQLRSELLAIAGVGPWTVNYTLMRGCAWLDGSLHGDAAVRRYLQVLLEREQLSIAQAQNWLEQFSPWRALVAAHLWQSQGLHG